MKGKIPAEVAALVPDSVQSGSPAARRPPAIVVATSPTELIVTEGPAKWAPVTGTDLLYVTNTDRDVFRTIDSPQMYVLLAGRWFRATHRRRALDVRSSRRAAGGISRRFRRRRPGPMCSRRFRARRRPMKR